MRNSVKPNCVDLQPKSKARLRDTSTGFEFMGECLDVRDHFLVNVGHKPGDNSAKQYPSKAWSRLTGQIALTQGHATSGRVGAGTEEFKFSKRHHEMRVSPCLSDDPVGRDLGSIVSGHDRRAS